MDLQTFFKENPVAALGFSGGVDSSYLLYAGMHYGAKIKAYYVNAAFQPAFELEDAKRLAAGLGADLTVLETDILSVPHVAENPSNRCYYCKTAIFSLIKETAIKDGYSILLDGTNASDDSGDRPGMRAIQELSVRSPLKDCGITKSDVRRLSKEAGLFTWDKPAYACLATRVPTGTAITDEALVRIEHAENALFAMGFTDFRVRLTGGLTGSMTSGLTGRDAKLQFPAAQFPAVLERREEIITHLQADFDAILLDLAGRRTEKG